MKNVRKVIPFPARNSITEPADLRELDELFGALENALIKRNSARQIFAKTQEAEALSRLYTSVENIVGIVEEMGPLLRKQMPSGKKKAA